MRHRFVSGTGLGNSDPELLNNKGELNPDFAKEVLRLYFEDFEGFDFQVEPEVVKVGIEPAYQYQPLKVITLHRNKNKSSISTGRAFGGYGSGIRSTTKYYEEYVYQSKFVKFVDRWHPKLFPGGAQ